MSIKLMSQVWEVANVEGSALLVLLALADHANDKDICWPSLPTLAKRARISERQAQRIIQKLVDDGHIEVLERGDGRGHSSVYKLTIKGDIQGKDDTAMSTLPEIKDDTTMSPIEEIKGDKLSTFNEERVTSEKERVTSSALKVDISSIKGDIAMSTESPIEPLKNHQPEEPTERDAADAAPLPASWVEFLEAFCWVCHGHKELSALTEKQKGILASEAKRVRDSGFTLDDLRAWFQNIWKKDYRWTKDDQHERPKPSDVRSMIPAIRDTEPEMDTPRYSIDIPGVVELRPNGESKPAPLPPPMATDDPWSIAVAELMQSAPAWVRWLKGSYLEESGELAGEPFYRVVLTETGANAEWLTQQAEPAIRKKLASLLGKRILLEIVTREGMLA